MRLFERGTLPTCRPLLSESRLGKMRVNSFDRGLICGIYNAPCQGSGAEHAGGLSEARLEDGNAAPHKSMSALEEFLAQGCEQSLARLGNLTSQQEQFRVESMRHSSGRSAKSLRSVVSQPRRIAERAVPSMALAEKIDSRQPRFPQLQIGPPLSTVT